MGYSDTPPAYGAHHCKLNQRLTLIRVRFCKFQATGNEIHKVAESYFYSLRKLFTGFASAAFTDWKLTVSRTISIASDPARANIHHSSSM